VQSGQGSSEVKRCIELAKRMQGTLPTTIVMSCRRQIQCKHKAYSLTRYRNRLMATVLPFTWYSLLEPASRNVRWISCVFLRWIANVFDKVGHIKDCCVMHIVNLCDGRGPRNMIDGIGCTATVQDRKHPNAPNI
jgi:hypothetical protein